MFGGLPERARETTRSLHRGERREWRRQDRDVQAHDRVLCQNSLSERFAARSHTQIERDLERVRQRAHACQLQLESFHQLVRAQVQPGRHSIRGQDQRFYAREVPCRTRFSQRTQFSNLLLPSRWSRSIRQGF